MVVLVVTVEGKIVGCGDGGDAGRGDEEKSSNWW